MGTQTTPKRRPPKLHVADSLGGGDSAPDDGCPAVIHVRALIAPGVTPREGGSAYARVYDTSLVAVDEHGGTIGAIVGESELERRCLQAGYRGRVVRVSEGEVEIAYQR